jgi:hypothetical protein
MHQLYSVQTHDIGVVEKDRQNYSQLLSKFVSVIRKYVKYQMV